MKKIFISVICIIFVAPIIFISSSPFSVVAQESSFHEVMRLGGRGTPTQLEWSPNGEILATNGKGGIWLYDKQLDDVGFLAGTDGFVGNIAWSPDGQDRSLGGGNFDPHTVRIWNVESNEIIYTLTLASESENYSSVTPRVAWSHDSQQLVTIALKDSLRLQAVEVWDIEDGARLHQVELEAETVNTPVWNSTSDQIAIPVLEPNPQLVISDFEHEPLVIDLENRITDIEWQTNDLRISGVVGSENLLWDASSGDLIDRTPLQTDLLSSDGSMSVSIERQMVTIIDENSGEVIDNFGIETESRFRRIDTSFWSKDSSKFVAAIMRPDPVIFVWNAATQQLDYQFNFGLNTWINELALSPDESVLVISDTFGTLQAWDFSMGRIIKTRWVNMSAVLGLAWHPDGTSIATASGGDSVIRIWDATTGDAKYTYEGHLGYVRDVAWHPDGDLIASSDTGSGNSSENPNFAENPATVRLWDPETSEDMAIFEVETNLGDFLTNLVWSPDGTKLAAIRPSNQTAITRIFVWDITTFEALMDVEVHATLSAEWHPNGITLITDRFTDNAFDQQQIVDWNIETGETRSIFENDVSDNNIRTIRRRPIRLGQTLLSNEVWAIAYRDGTVQLWNRITGDVISTLQTTNDSIYSPLVWSPDGQFLVTDSTSEENRLHPTGQIWRFSDDATESEAYFTLDGHLLGIGGIFAFDWSPDGRFLASAGSYGDIIILEYVE